MKVGLCLGFQTLNQVTAGSLRKDAKIWLKMENENHHFSVGGLSRSFVRQAKVIFLKYRLQNKIPVFKVHNFFFVENTHFYDE